MTRHIDSDDFDKFAAKFQTYFALDRAPSADDALVEDLRFDSLALYEVVALLDEAAGQPVPDEVVADLLDVSDVYHYFTIYSQ